MSTRRNGMRTLESRRLALLVVFGATVLLAWTVPSWALTFTVNSTADEVDAAAGDGSCATASGTCTLRAAIQEANAQQGAHEIVLPAGTYTSTIPGQGEEAAATGDLDITGNLTITGAGTSATIVDGNALDRVIEVHSGAVVTISDTTIQNGENGESPFAGAGISNAGTLSLLRSVVANNHGTGVYSGGGGGIFNAGTLSLESSAVRDNTAAYRGGGICNLSGTVSLKNSTVSNNTETYGGGGGIANLCGSVTVIGSVIRGNNTGANGGGINNEPWLGYSCSGGTTLAVIDSTVDGNLTNVLNSRGNAGGGINNSGQLTMTRSTVSNNQGWSGGGLCGGGVIVDSTISGNAAFYGGGLTGESDLTNVTVTNNTAYVEGGGIYGGADNRLGNTILAANRAEGLGADCGKAWLHSKGYNLLPTDADLVSGVCSLYGDLTGNIKVPDAKLAPLGDYGGPTQTHALLPGSPAIDAGSPAAPGTGGNACAATDQRGVSRPQGPACDMGAFEAASTGGLGVFAISPRNAGNSQPVLAVVTGSGFAQGATVKLARAGEADVVGSPSNAWRDGLITASFDLTGRAAGSWDVVVTNPDNASAVLPAGFTVDEAGAPHLWVDFMGRIIAQKRIDLRPRLFTILVGNRGNVDALAVLLTIAGIPEEIGQLTPNFSLTPPPPQAGQVPADWSQVPIGFVSGDHSFPPSIVLILPVVPAGQTVMLDFTLSAPLASLGQTINLMAAAVPGYLSTDPETSSVAAISTGARTYALSAWGIEVPEEKDPILRQYLSTSIQGVIDRGINAWLNNLGAKGEVYALAQVLFDLAQYAVERDPAALTWADCVSLTDWKWVGTPGPGGSGHCDPPYGNPGVATSFVGLRAGYRSMDPNQKGGTTGIGDARYISGEKPLWYGVYFENLETATAPAQEVIITDQLDANKMDLTTFSLGPISFADRTVVPPPGLSQFTDFVDLRPAQNLILRIDARLDKGTGIATWRFLSLDPLTLQLPEDPLAGFLPPNLNPPEGEGSVVFFVKPKPELATGTQITNQAQIVFDVNSAINTPEWLNTIDNTKPTSMVSPLAATQSSTSFAIQWSGGDAGAGINTFTIFVSDNGGAFSPWVSNTTNISATFSGQQGHSYAFYSVATDLVGNEEDAKTVPDTTTQVIRCLLEVDTSGAPPDVATDLVYVFRQLLGLPPVPTSFRMLGASIPPDDEIAARINALAAMLDVDMNGTVDVATDIVYIARRLLGLPPVPANFRMLDPSIPPDATIAAKIDALCS